MESRSGGAGAGLGFRGACHASDIVLVLTQLAYHRVQEKSMEKWVGEEHKGVRANARAGGAARKVEKARLLIYGGDEPPPS